MTEISHLTSKNNKLCSLTDGETPQTPAGQVRLNDQCLEIR